MINNRETGTAHYLKTLKDVSIFIDLNYRMVKFIWISTNDNRVIWYLE